MIGKAQLVATAPSINDPVLIEVEQVGVVVPVVCLAPPVSLCLVHQLPCVLAQQIALVRLFLHKTIKIFSTLLGAQQHDWQILRDHMSPFCTGPVLMIYLPCTASSTSHPIGGFTIHIKGLTQQRLSYQSAGCSSHAHFLELRIIGLTRSNIG